MSRQQRGLVSGWRRNAPAFRLFSPDQRQQTVPYRTAAASKSGRLDGASCAIAPRHQKIVISNGTHYDAGVLEQLVELVVGKDPGLFTPIVAYDLFTQILTHDTGGERLSVFR